MGAQERADLSREQRDQQVGGDEKRPGHRLEVPGLPGVILGCDVLTGSSTREMLEGARGYPHMGRKKDGNLRSRRPNWASGFLVPSSGSASDRRGVLDKSLSFSEPQFPTPPKKWKEQKCLRR